MHLLVTGGAGFIGKNFIRQVLSERPDYEITNLDALTYAGTLAGLPEDSDHYHFVHGNIRDEGVVEKAMSDVDAVIHFAAESHVDRSILSSSAFISTNVGGTQVLLDAARQCHVDTFIQVSTDEVYGTLGSNDAAFTEMTPLAPRSPYAASKAASDLLALSYFETHAMDVRITRCSNNYGPYQFPEKLLPLTIVNGLHGLPIPLYGDGRQRRDWIHVEDHCRGILAVLDRGAAGEVYNIGAEQEVENVDAVLLVLDALKVDRHLITYVKDRPGHDRRYAMNPSKIRGDLDWRPRYSFAEGLEETVLWYQQNENWWRPLLDDAYQSYYRAQYGAR